MITLVSVVVQSIVKEPVKHVINTAAGTVGVGVAPNDWLALAVGITAILTGLVIIYKTYKEIILLNRKISELNKRKRPK